MTRKLRNQPTPAAARAIDSSRQEPWHLCWARRAIFAVFLLFPLLFLSPDVQLLNPTDMPRRLLLALLAGLLPAAVLYGWGVEGKAHWRRHLLDLPVLLFFLGAFIAGLRGVYPMVSLFSTLWVQDFTALTALGIGVALYFGVKEFIHGEKPVEDAAFALVLVGGVEAIIALLDHFCHLGLHPAFSGHRLVGTLGNPMFAGTFFAMLIPLAIGAALGTANLRRRPWLLASIAVMSLALLLTYYAQFLGRGGRRPASSLPCWRAGAYWPTRQRLSPVVLAVSLAALLVTLALGMLIPQLRSRVLSITNSRDETRQTRVVYMTAAWRIFRARPLSGWGRARCGRSSRSIAPPAASWKMDCRSIVTTPRRCRTTCCCRSPRRWDCAACCPSPCWWYWYLFSGVVSPRLRAPAAGWGWVCLGCCSPIC